MYEFIKGTVVERNPAFAVIESNGIGYILNISLHTYSQIKENEHCKLFAHLVVKEDALTLFGFSEAKERELFRFLITVSGVGANTARMILSSFSPGEIARAIAEGNSGLLQSIKGIGAKTAQRIIIDLKDKLSKDLLPFEKLGKTDNLKKDEALSGLIILGFTKGVAEKALNKVTASEEGDTLSVEELIRRALKIL